MTLHDPSPAEPPVPPTEPGRPKVRGTVPGMRPSATRPGAPETSAAPELIPGQVLAGRWHVVRFLAQGGMGAVYEAEDLKLGGRVALKTLRRQLAAEAAAAERFRREILLSRRVTHANVCRIFDFGEHGRVQFLTMELLEGETLAARLRRAGRMSEAEALPLVRQMAAALAAAHDTGVVHRDFKCANVILVPRRDASASGVRVVVTDLGLARANSAEDAAGESGLAGLSQAGIFIGTPEYMAPEQVEGLPAGPAADIYALGIVLYEMLTGSRPFTAETPMAAAVKRVLEPPTPPRRLVPSLDPRWEAAILRCLQRAPEARFAHVLQLLQALEPS
jgi:eukaryotic-like serine/threonine-protein kinase